MTDTAAEEFLTRVLAKLKDMPRDKFNSESWKYEDRPTSEGVGVKPDVSIDVDKFAAHVLDVENYPGNVKYVESIEVLNKTSDSDFNYVQKVKLPALGGMQMALHIADLGERDGYRVIAWDQDDAGTEALDKNNGGARTEYNLGAWLISPTEVAYALSASPRKKDVGSIKFAIMTKGSDATVGTVLSSTIDGMIEWSQK